MKIPLISAVLSLFLLTGCGPKRIDGSSKEAFKKSLEAMSKSLNEDQRKELSEAVMTLGFADGMNGFRLGAAHDVMEQRIRDNVHGKTFSEIQTAVATLKKQRAEEREKKEKQRAEERAKYAAKKKAQIESEITELEAEKAKAVEAAATLEKFQVLRSRFYFSDSGFGAVPVVEITVKNGLPGAVAKVYFAAVLSSPGRSVPWVNESFNYSITGGLESGEEATWKLAPNRFGEWGQAPKNRQDMVLTVKAIKVDAANGETMFDSVFSESKQARLKNLKESLAMKANEVP
jgi:hypothetical protein